MRCRSRRGPLAALFGIAGVFAATAAVAVPKPVPPGFAVASADPAATRAGIEILRRGGNAFDAAVAVSAALAVVQPYASGLGGGGFWLLGRAADDSQVLVDGRETAPGAASAAMYRDAGGRPIADLSRKGPKAAGIPGEPAALVWIAQHDGKLGLAADLAPAIALADKGFRVDAMLAHRIAGNARRLSPAAARVFLPGGKPPAVGSSLRQPNLAATLRALAAHGGDGFYHGPVARALLVGVRGAGGIWSAEDLARYRAKPRRPIVTYFHDDRIVSTPPPSAGGVVLAEALHQIEIRGWSGAPTARQAAMVIEALRRADRDRDAFLGDPAFADVPLTRLLSTYYADFLAHTTDPAHATPRAALPSPAAVGGHLPREGDDTSAFSIVDAQGNRVAATVSLNRPFGCGYMAPGTGVLVNDAMDDFSVPPKAAPQRPWPNQVAPYKRPLSSMNPSFVDGPNGALVLGTTGGRRIDSAVLLGILDFVRGDGVRHIVAAPRYHLQYRPDVVQYESGALSVRVIKRLRAMGYHLRRVARYGDMQAVLWNPDNGSLTAASDPRGNGRAQVEPVPAEAETAGAQKKASS